MIPKRIHFCWFSREEYPDNIKKCLNTWHEILPDYEIIKWDGDNFDFSVNKYAQEAYENKKWAFASDYVRLYVLYHYGGIYLDSDIEVLKSFDPLLENKAFTGFESQGSVAAWIFGTEKSNPIFKEFLEHYENRSFVKPDGKFDVTPNPIPISKICAKHGMKNIDEMQVLDEITIYPERFFSGKSIVDGKIRITNDTYTIHHFDGTWQSERERTIKAIKYKIFGLMGEGSYPLIRKWYRYFINK